MRTRHWSVEFVRDAAGLAWLVARPLAWIVPAALVVMALVAGLVVSVTGGAK